MIKSQENTISEMRNQHDIILKSKDQLIGYLSNSYNNNMVNNINENNTYKIKYERLLKEFDDLETENKNMKRKYENKEQELVLEINRLKAVIKNQNKQEMEVDSDVSSKSSNKSRSKSPKKSPRKSRSTAKSSTDPETVSELGAACIRAVINTYKQPNKWMDVDLSNKVVDTADRHPGSTFCRLKKNEAVRLVILSGIPAPKVKNQKSGEICSTVTVLRKYLQSSRILNKPVYDWITKEGWDKYSKKPNDPLTSEEIKKFNANFIDWDSTLKSKIIDYKELPKPNQASQSQHQSQNQNDQNNNHNRNHNNNQPHQQEQGNQSTSNNGKRSSDDESDDESNQDDEINKSSGSDKKQESGM